MRRTLSAAATTAMLVAASIAVVPIASASAQSQSIANPIAGASGTRITSVDVDYNPTSLTITDHVAEFDDASYSVNFFVQPTETITEASDYALFTYSVSAGVVGSVSAVHLNNGSNSSLSTSGIVASVSSGTVNITIPTATIPYPGDVYTWNSIDGDDYYYAAQADVGMTATGFGPFRSGPYTTTTAATFISTSQTYGGVSAGVVVRVTPAAAGTVNLVDGAAVVASAPVSDGIAILAVPSRLSSGAHSLVATFVPADAAHFASSSSVAQSFVVKSIAKATKTTVSLSKKSQTYKKKSVAKLTVKVSSSSAAGSVKVYDGKKLLKTVKVKKGKASYSFSKTLKKGTHTIKAVFVPKDAEAYKTSTSKTVKLKVTK